MSMEIKMINKRILYLIRLSIVIITVFFTASSLCTQLIAMVDYPACHQGIHILENGRFYHIGYDLEEYEFSIIDDQMQVVFKSKNVVLAKPQDEIVEIVLSNGQKGKINVLTREINIEGIFV